MIDSFENLRIIFAIPKYADFGTAYFITARRTRHQPGGRRI
jgi:hypothetical protein